MMSGLRSWASRYWRSTSSVYCVGFQARGLCVKTCTTSAPISAPRVRAGRSVPPARTWAPIGMGTKLALPRIWSNRTQVLLTPTDPKGRNMADILSAKARQPIARPVLASLASLGADGSPQVTPLWIDLDGDDLLFHTAQGRGKARHIERDPRVAVSVIDPDDPYNVVALRG